MPADFFRNHFPQCTLRLNNDFPPTAQVERLFPADAAGFRRLCERIRQTDAFSPTAPELSARSIVNDYLSSPLLQDMLLCPVMLYGNPQAEDMDFNQFCIIFRSVIFEGFGRPHHGMKPFLECLLKRYRDQGGELSLGVEVTKLNVCDGRIASVVTDQGEELHADAILSCAGALETARLCSSPPPELASFPAGPIGFCESIFELNRRPRELGLEACVIFRNCQSASSFPRLPGRRPLLPNPLARQLSALRRHC